MGRRLDTFSQYIVCATSLQHQMQRHALFIEGGSKKESVKAPVPIQRERVDGDMTCSAFNCSVFRLLICILDCNLPVTVNDAGARPRSLSLSLTHHHPSTWRHHVCTKAIDCSWRRPAGCMRPVNERCILYQQPFISERCKA